VSAVEREQKLKQQVKQLETSKNLGRTGLI
jgi:hypothetical protein